VLLEAASMGSCHLPIPQDVREIVIDRVRGFLYRVKDEHIAGKWNHDAQCRQMSAVKWEKTRMKIIKSTTN